MTNITELAQRMKAAAEKATPGPWYVHDKPCEDGNYGIDTSDKEFLAEAVVWWGFARQSIWREEDAKYIALANPANILALVEALEKSEKTSEARREAIGITHKRAARERDRANAAEEALEKAQAQSSKWLEAYHKAVSIGARYEERIAELESRTVKLPDFRHEHFNSDWGEHDAEAYQVALREALIAAGIKVEAE
ncbi:ead/Ea22-like family protein [Klebsiella pneumoniae]|uniref:ead/Ea22-like family protein n=1 Tax=Klebsiella pneumoniae TaxID=573 RepID=UPI000B421258|nr:ead/Ea22-like family protein [Klebsiella pneumoniae]RNT55562.1 ead/Ea22-like family protein [Klebsiella pneumoniae]